jgi:predicted MFS family arabinose efflux permease
MTRDAGRPRLPGSMRLVTTAWVLSATADSFLFFALIWVAGPQGWSGPEIAGVVLALRLPALVGGMLGGRAVDRFGGRPLILLDVSGRAVLMVVLAVAGWNGALPLSVVLAAGALAGALAPLSHAGTRWLVPRLVPGPALPRANAALSLGDQLPLLGGAALIAPVFALFGPGPALLVPAAMLVLAAALIVRLRREAGSSEDVAAQPGASRLAASAPASRSPWRSRRVLAIIGLSVAYYFVYGPFETVSPPFIRQQLGGGQGTYALLWSLFGIGAIVTLPLAARLSPQRPGLVNAIGAIVWGLVMLPVAFTAQVWATAALFLLGGAVWGPYSSVEATALHGWTDPAHHGRVFGTQRALLSTAAPLGAAIGAVGLDYLSPASIIAASSAACAGAGLLSLCLPDLRRPTASEETTTTSGPSAWRTRTGSLLRSRSPVLRPPPDAATRQLSGSDRAAAEVR